MSITVKDVLTDFLRHSGWWSGNYDQSIAACPWFSKYGTTETEKAATLIDIMQEADRWLRRWFFNKCPGYPGLRCYTASPITITVAPMNLRGFWGGIAPPIWTPGPVPNFGYLLLAIDMQANDPNMIQEVRVKSYKSIPQLSQYAKKLIVGGAFSFLEKTPYALMFTKKNEVIIQPPSFGSRSMYFYYFEAGGLMTTTTDVVVDDNDYLDMLVKRMMMHAFGYIQRDASEPAAELKGYQNEMLDSYGQGEIVQDLDVQGLPQ